MTRLLLITTFVALQFLSTGAFGQGIAVPNFSFEEDVQPDPGANFGATSWLGIRFPLTENPPADVFSGAGGFGTPTGGDGPQSALLVGEASFQSAASLAAVLSDATYTLTIAIGDRATDEAGTLRIGFLIDDAFVAGGDTIFDGSNYSPEGTFSDFTFEYTAQSTDAGKTLKIFLGQTQPSSTSVVVNYDNVRLSVPEPSTYALLGLGALALLLWRGKKSTAA